MHASKHRITFFLAALGLIALTACSGIPFGLGRNAHNGTGSAGDTTVNAREQEAR